MFASIGGGRSVCAGICLASGTALNTVKRTGGHNRSARLAWSLCLLHRIRSFLDIAVCELFTMTRLCQRPGQYWQKIQFLLTEVLRHVVAIGNQLMAEKARIARLTGGNTRGQWVVCSSRSKASAMP